MHEFLPKPNTDKIKADLGDNIRIGIFLDNESGVIWKSEEQSQEDGGQLFANIVIQEYVRVVKTPNSNIRLLNLSKLIEGKVKKNTSSTLEEIKQLVDIYNLDAVYLPEMQAPEIITSKDQPSPIDQIRNLRNKTVLLSAGDKNKNEFPACEVICIGLLDYLETPQIASGILDLWVSVSDTSSGDKELVGKARGIAFVASILDKSKKKDTGLYNAMRRTANTRKFIIDFFSTQTYENYGFGELLFDSNMNKIEEKLKSFTCDMIEPPPVAEDPYVSLTRTDLKNLFVEWEEKKTLVNIQENITIVVAASPVSCESTLKGINVKALIDGKDADVTINKKHKDTIGTQFVQNLAHYLGDIKGETSASIINIVVVEIKKDEKMVNIKDDVYSKKVKDILEKKPDIVYISASGKVPERGHGIKGTLLKLCEDSIVITGARTFERRMAPPAFPGESVICAGREGGPHGSLLDFVSNTTQKTSETSDESWAAAAETVCIAAAVLLKAQVLNLSSEKYTRLKNTAVMQNILARMCSHYPEHRCRDGYGTLMPTKLLTEEANDEFEKLINEVTDDEAPKTYWSGKTVT